MKSAITLLLLALLFSVSSCTKVNINEKGNNTLYQEFQNPPDKARPRVWWHWMNGNITKEGIRKDLEWMNRVGIRGVHNFDASIFTPQVVDKPLVFMSDDWKDAFQFTTNLADNLDFELTIAGSPGWSETGGPWVKATDAMKKYVWTETRLKGGQTFNGVLPWPSDVPGNFQNVRMAEEGILFPVVGKIPNYYKDVMVIAYKLSKTDYTLAELNPTLKSSGGNFNVKFLTDGDFNTTKYLPPGKVGEDFWVQYQFDSPQTFRAMSVVGANHIGFEEFNGGPENRRLLVGDNGVDFTEVARIPGRVVPQNTIAFPATTARIWRLAYETLPPAVNQPEGVKLAEFVLYPTDRIDQFEDKAGFSPWKEDSQTYRGSEADAVAIGDVINLTDKMDDDGTLTWEVPAGDWAVIRFGYGITGRQNHPASPAGTGLEVDKLDAEAVRRYINTYLDMYKDATAGLMGDRGLQYIILDSYEAGFMNWTHDFPEEFEARRGYSLIPWIPVLTGRIVESREASEKFLWDFRKTIGEMIVENHYDVIGEELKKRGMGRYTESHERNRAYLADGMDVKRNANVPMSAMWTPGSLSGDSDEEVISEADIREAASVSHIYGKPYVAAESMTSVGRAFQEYPERLKRTADMEMASGLNRFVIHTSVHQPLDDKIPGLTLGPFGQYFTRHETWAEQGKAWIDYLSRSSYMLQQGKFIADALVYYGENTNITWVFNQALPKIPGYEYDFVNSTALMEAVTAQNGKMVTPGGGSYSVLVLDDSAKEMTLPVLRKIKELADAGVAITGTKPERTPSLTDNVDEFNSLVKEIWAKANVTNIPADKVLKTNGISKDVIIKGNSAEIRYVHRSTPNKEIYWLDNRSVEKNQAEISFRVSGKIPVLWHPETSEVRQVSWEMKDGRTIVPLSFESWEAYFIVFDKKTNKTSFELPATKEHTIGTVSGPWRVSFQKNRGAPENTTFETLTSWTEHEDQGIKYFSGTATYQNTFQLGAMSEDSRIVLDLGQVKNLAEVIINDKNLGVLWKTPFKVDITDAVKSGENILEVRVTNVWVNRLIGDAQPGVEEKITFTTMPMVQPNQPLLPSGLLGPVKLVEVEH